MLCIVYNEIDPMFSILYPASNLYPRWRMRRRINEAFTNSQLEHYTMAECRAEPTPVSYHWENLHRKLAKEGQNVHYLGNSSQKFPLFKGRCPRKGIIYQGID